MPRVSQRPRGAKKAASNTTTRRKASQRPAGKPRPASPAKQRRPKPKSTAATPLPAALFDALRALARRFGAQRIKTDVPLCSPEAQRDLAIMAVLGVLLQLITMLERWASPEGQALRREASRFGGFTTRQGIAPAAAPPSPPPTAEGEPDEHPPRVFLTETIAFFDRWNARDWADVPGERRAADLVFVLLSLAAKVARNVGSTEWLRFVETEADKLYTSARAIERGEKVSPPAPTVATTATPPAATSTAQHRPAPPAATPRHASPTMRLLGIERAHDSKTLHEASTAELLAWSFCGDPPSDPIDGMLAALDDDLNILRSAVESRDGVVEDAELCMQLYRLETRAEVARLLYQRLVNAIDAGALSAEKGGRS